jgi:hypothetical protein
MDALASPFLTMSESSKQRLAWFFLSLLALATAYLIVALILGVAFSSGGAS